MTFVIIGGGPTGVELAGALAEIARHTLTHDFRHINPPDAKVVLVEAASHVLSHYPPDLVRRAVQKIETLGIDIQTLTRVVDIQPDHVGLQTATSTHKLPARTVLWAAGVQASPLAARLAAATGTVCDRSGRIPVQPDLTLPGHPEIVVVGDIASCPDASGRPLPGLAPVAIQQGRYAANIITAEISGEQRSGPFRYHDRGTMATIGRAVAVAQIGSRQFCGYFAWLMWLFIHLMQIAQFENRLLVLLQWMWNYVTFNRSARLITEVPAPERRPIDDDPAVPGS